MSQHDEPTTTAMQWMAHDGIKIKTEPMQNASPSSASIDMAALIMAQQHMNHQQHTSAAFYPDAMASNGNHHQQSLMSPPPHQFLQQHFGQSNHHQHLQQQQQQQHLQEQQTAAYMPSMFNPLTPPGYSNAVMLAAVHQKLQEHQQQQQQQQLLQLHQQQHQHQQQQPHQQQQQQPLPAHVHPGHQSPTDYMQRQSTPFQSIAHRMPRADANVSPIPLILTPNITPPIIADESSPADSLNGADAARTPPPAASSLMVAGDKSHESPESAHFARMCSSPTSDTSKVSNAYEESIYKPRYNAKGDAKQCKCKQCDYVTIVKAELWVHSVQHMNPDKILRCPQCPFVTEYKHHLDFHRRNHTGDKPFQCKLCKYCCVNNSMLKSHMKSHSDVHQYKCADCPYTSKYCHSMKLHLRNKLHKPALELGEDGLPKTGAFIDVYGSRRGPKARSTGAIEASGDQAIVKKVRRTKVKRDPGAAGMMHQLTEQQQAYVRQCLHAKQMQQMKEEIHHEDEQEQTMRHMLLLLAKLNAQNQGFAVTPVSDEADMSVDESGCSEDEGDDNGLDLSVPHGSADTKEMAPPTATSSDTPRLSTSSSHRRKGRAFKLSTMQEPEPIEATNGGPFVDRLQPTLPAAVHPEEHSCKNEITWPAQPESSMPTSSTGPAWSRPCSADIAAAVDAVRSQSPPARPVYVEECRPCGIQFSDRVIHRLHMGYHGFNDPFTCNMCGSKCSDRVMFNMHIASQAH